MQKRKQWQAAPSLSRVEVDIVRQGPGEKDKIPVPAHFGKIVFYLRLSNQMVLFVQTEVETQDPTKLKNL